jgi:hypothetical protein
MVIFRRLGEMLQYVWDGAARIFSPNDDNPPETDTQPYEGDKYQEQR